MQSFESCSGYLVLCVCVRIGPDPMRLPADVFSLVARTGTTDNQYTNDIDKALCFSAVSRPSCLLFPFRVYVCICVCACVCVLDADTLIQDALPLHYSVRVMNW